MHIMAAKNIAHDNPGMQYAAGTAARACSAPTEQEMQRVVRAARYLRGMPLVEWKFELDKEPETIVVYSDSDWAGDAITRRSTSGGAATLDDRAALQTWSRAQGPKALSSMEAEYYGLVSACQEGRWLQSLVGELLGRSVNLILRTDSDAARLSIEKLGMMKTKHMELRFLFLKQLQDDHVIALERVWTHDNIADLMTKALTAQRRSELDELSLRFWHAMSAEHAKLSLA